MLAVAIALAWAVTGHAQVQVVFYAPAPVYVQPAPVATYYAPAPTTVYYAPRPVATAAYYAPAPVVTTVARPTLAGTITRVRTIHPPATFVQPTVTYYRLD